MTLPESRRAPCPGVRNWRGGVGYSTPVAEDSMLTLALRVAPASAFPASTRRPLAGARRKPAAGAAEGPGRQPSRRRRRCPAGPAGALPPGAPGLGHGDRRPRSRAAPRWVWPEDCRTVLPRLAADSVALVLTDPPYFTDRMGSDWRLRDLRSRVKPGVVGGLPGGMRFDPRQGRDLYRFLLPLAQQWLRLLKPGGFALCFAHRRLAHRTAAAIEDAGFQIRDLLAWRHEGQAKAFTQDHFVRARDLPEREKIRILRALGGRRTPQLKPQMEMIVLAQAPRAGTFVDNWLTYRTGLVDVSNPLIEPDRFPGTLIPCPGPKKRYGHLTAKPVRLLRHLIRIFCAPGPDTVVLDPFAGSGSTGVAARLEGRGFLGVEIESAMAATAERRVRRPNAESGNDRQH